MKSQRAADSMLIVMAGALTVEGCRSVVIPATRAWIRVSPTADPVWRPTLPLGARKRRRPT